MYKRGFIIFGVVSLTMGNSAEILGKNLSDFDVRFQLRLGFLLYQMNEM